MAAGAVALLSDVEVGLAPAAGPQPVASQPRLLSDAEVFGDTGATSLRAVSPERAAELDLLETGIDVTTAGSVDEAIDAGRAVLDRSPRESAELLTDDQLFAGAPRLLADDEIGLPLSDEEVAARLAAGENITEAQPFQGFWSRAIQAFKEHTTLDENLLSIASRKALAGRVIDPATGERLTEDEIRAQQNERRGRKEYLLAGAEPAEGILEHAGDFAGVVARETTAPTALATGPVGATRRGLARAATMAVAGGAYETVAGTAEQIARDDAITDPGAIAMRGVAGAVAAPVLDIAVRKAGEGVATVAKKVFDRLRGTADDAQPGAAVVDLEPDAVPIAAMERQGVPDPTETPPAVPGEVRPRTESGGRDDLYRQIGVDLGGVSHMGPLIETAARTIDHQGSKGGRAVLRDLLEQDAARLTSNKDQPHQIEPEAIDQLTDELAGEIEKRLGTAPATGHIGEARRHISTPEARTGTRTEFAPPEPRKTTMQAAFERARKQRELDTAAHEAATSPANDLPEPTEAQRDASNFKMGHARVSGLDVTVEFPKGSVRSGTSANGEAWRREMTAHYGRIRRTEGADGEQVDVFLGDNPASERVFVVDQVKPDSQTFDEHKSLVGYDDLAAARQAYLDNYPKDWKGLGDITEVSMDVFKSWLKDGDTSKPFTALRDTDAARAATGRSGFEVAQIGESMVAVSGEHSAIREALAAAGVPFKGLTHRSGALAFPRKYESRIRAALTPRDELELPGDIAHQWMPGERHVGMINDAILPTAERAVGTVVDAKPIRREDVLAPFLKAIGIPLYQGRVKSKRMLGFYRPKKEEVRIKKQNDLEVAAHEIAHAIDDRVPEVRKSWMTGPQSKVLREELRGVSYDKTKIFEGFAEFVRLYMTQNEKAREMAPKFYDWFKGFTGRHKYGPAIEQAREGMTNWFQQSAVKRAASKIGQGHDVNEALYGPLRAFRQSVSDDLDGVYRMERELTGEVAPAGVYESARLTRASYSMVEGALTLGRPVARPDGSFKFEGAGLQQILKPVSDDLDNWTLYAVGRSAAELHAQGREKLFTTTEIRAMRALETPAFKKAFDDYQAWNRAVVDFAERLGLINPETRRLWQRAQYLPFHRVGQGGAGAGKAVGAEGTWSGIKRLTGGTGNIRDVLGNLIQNAGGLMTAALRNDARVRVADMADQVRGGGRFMAKVPKVSKAVKVSREEVMRVVKDAGITDDMIAAVNKLGGAPEDSAALADFVTMFQHAQAPTGKNLVAVYRGGKPDYYEVIDPILMRSFASLNRPAKNWLVRFLNGVRRIGQSSITISADFMAANIARDTLMGGIMSRHGFKPFLDSIRGMKSRVTKDPAYREFIANGGGFSSHLVDEQAFKKHLQRFYAKQGINPKFVIDAPGKLLYFLETLVDSFEVSTRLGEFKRAQAAGAHPRHAAYSAREVSTDFGMRGDSEVLGFFYDTVMFLKAGVNGIDRSYRGFAHDPNRLHIAAKTGVLALTSMALYAYNRKFDEYRDMEDWKKDSYWHFFVPKGNGEHHHFMYPKIWEIGAMASIAERSLEHLMDGDMAQYAVDFARVVMNQFKFDYMPHAFAPVYEQYLNRSRFTGRPIETQGMESLAPFARSKPYTAESLKDLGLATRNLPRQLQIPPARAEALLRGYFNTWALYGLTLTDAMRYDDQPNLRADQYPVVRRFYSADPERHSRYETEFYDLLREATELRRTVRHLDRINRGDIAGEIEARPGADQYTQINFVNEQLQQVQEDMFRVKIEPTLTPEEKRRQIDALTREKDALLKQTVRDVQNEETADVH